MERGLAMTIQTTDLLEFLSKADKVSPYVNIFKKEEGYKITLYCDWHNDNNFYEQSIFIDNDGESDWKSGDYDFYTMDNILDQKLREEEQRLIKAQKRKELIDSLTPEQRELLDLS
jgi:hypothetical protein